MKSNNFANRIIIQQLQLDFVKNYHNVFYESLTDRKLLRKRSFSGFLRVFYVKSNGFKVKEKSLKFCHDGCKNK